MEKRIENIQLHEKTLDKANALINELENWLDKWGELHPDFQNLMKYYGSPQWQEDVDTSNKGTFSDFPHGVLSQDAVYDMYTNQRNLNFKMIRTALDYLES